VKRVLFDENMPRKLRCDLPEFFIRTAQEEGWGSFRNGELLKRAESSFAVLVTIDQRMRYQQNIATFNIGIVAIELPDTRIVFLRALIPQMRVAIEHVRPGEIVVISPEPA
jgi:hypothetical protein